MAEPVEVVCPVVEADCRCTLVLGHDVEIPHTCKCGGAFFLTADGIIEPVRWPGGKPVTLPHSMGALFGDVVELLDL